MWHPRKEEPDTIVEHVRREEARKMKAVQEQVMMSNTASTICLFENQVLSAYFLILSVISLLCLLAINMLFNPKK